MPHLVHPTTRNRTGSPPPPGPQSALGEAGWSHDVRFNAVNLLSKPVHEYLESSVKIVGLGVAEGVHRHTVNTPRSRASTMAVFPGPIRSRIGHLRSDTKAAEARLTADDRLLRPLRQRLVPHSYASGAAATPRGGSFRIRKPTIDSVLPHGRRPRCNATKAGASLGVAPPPKPIDLRLLP